ncbi:MAG TPA: MFS transporter [Beijerinckiaceae bacterium]|nr:MFS transporter [Beijerinckiaceae bacterium]
MTRPARGARIAALHVANFVGIGVYLPFFPLWLASRSLDATTIGAILAIPIVVRVVATAPLLSLLDRGVGVRGLLLAAYGAQVAAYAILGFADGAAIIAVIVALTALAQAPAIPATDLVTLEATRRDPRLDYGRIRLWGSVAFLAATVGAGYLLAAARPDAILWTLAAAALGAVLVALSLPRADAAGPAPRPAGGRAARLPRGLWYVIGAAACIQGSHAAVYAFGSLHWSAIGFSKPSIGYLWWVGVVLEIAAFAFLGRRIASVPVAVAVLALGGVAALVRAVGLWLSPGFGATLALQGLHAVTFGTTHLATMAALSRLAPDGARGRAQGMLGALTAFVSATATVGSGLVFRAAGPLVFAAMAPLAALGLAFAVLAWRSLAQPHRDGEGGRTRLPS